jgi:hypothetical protein
MAEAANKTVLLGNSVDNAGNVANDPSPWISQADLDAIHSGTRPVVRMRCGGSEHAGQDGKLLGRPAPEPEPAERNIELVVPTVTADSKA